MRNRQLTPSLYDALHEGEARNDLAFYLRRLHLPSKILEIGCGTGRLTIPLARAGYAITGIDTDAVMMARLQSKLENEPHSIQERITVIQANMVAFHLPDRRFDVVIVPFRAFNHLLSVEEQVSALACFREHLLPGGRLILDLFVPSESMLYGDTLKTFPEEGIRFTLPDKRQVHRRERVVAHDSLQQNLTFQFEATVEGESEPLIEEVTLRYLHRFEAEHLLYRCGFVPTGMYCDYEEHPIGWRYPGDLVLVAIPSS